jgi:hypothetical protein
LNVVLCRGWRETPRRHVGTPLSTRDYLEVERLKMPRYRGLAPCFETVLRTREREYRKENGRFADRSPSLVKFPLPLSEACCAV